MDNNTNKKQETKMVKSYENPSRGINQYAVIGITSLILTLFILIAYKSYHRNNQNPDNNNQSSQSAKLVDTTNWSTYRNEKRNYSIKYPKEWGVKSEFDIDNTSLNATLYRYTQKTSIIKDNYLTSSIISVWKKEQSFSLIDWIKKYQLNFYNDYSGINNSIAATISDQPAIIIPIDKEETAQQYTAAFIDGGDTVYRIFYAGKNTEEYLAILSTFSLENTASNYNLPKNLLYTNLDSYSFDEKGSYSYAIKSGNDEILITIPVSQEVPEKYYETIGDIVGNNNNARVSENRLSLSFYQYSNSDKKTYITLVPTSVIESGWNEELKGVIEIEITENNGIISGSLINK